MSAKTRGIMRSIKEPKNPREAPEYRNPGDGTGTGPLASLTCPDTTVFGRRLIFQF
jgi:hypothetical protein